MKEVSIAPPYLSLELDNSLLIAVYKKDLTVDLSIAKYMVKERLSFIRGNNYPMLADVRYVRLITKEARDYLAKDDGIKGITALAVLVESHLTQIIANLFMTFSRPAIPMKIFRTREHAIKWLNQFSSPENDLLRHINTN